ncbi:MAG: hypothetical protein KDA83_21980 [Planctomycetales bacterium]|nr:hypothetical protein [Planctomycetales bacterium]
MFLPPTVYIVEPNEQLLSQVFPTESLRDCVAQPKAWQNEEGPSELTNNDRVIIAKQVILAYFLSFEEFDEMLGRPMVSEATFDRYWSIRRLSIDGGFHHLAEYAKRIERSRFISTGNSFLDRVVAKSVGLVEKSTRAVQND